MRNPQNLSSTLSKTFNNLMKNVYTSIPAIVLDFDASKQLAKIQIAIQGVDRDNTPIEQPPLIEVPVYFSGSTNFSIQHELNKNDEGIALFSQRCIDNWMSKGAGNPPNMFRFHSIADAMFLPGLRSKPQKISDFNNEGIGLYKSDGTQKICIKSDGTIEIETTGAAKINGSQLLPGGNIICASITPGAITPPAGQSLNIGSADSSDPVLINGVNMNTHTHSVTGTTSDGKGVTGSTGTPNDS